MINQGGQLAAAAVVVAPILELCGAYSFWNIQFGGKFMDDLLTHVRATTQGVIISLCYSVVIFLDVASH